jgi:hypothetical protein
MSTAAIATRPIGSTHGNALSDAAVTIGIVAGEASGDALAATLIQAVRARLPQARFVGIAGPKMLAAGCEAWHPLETLAVRGLTEVVGNLPRAVFGSAARWRAVLRANGCRCSSASTHRISISDWRES